MALNWSFIENGIHVRKIRSSFVYDQNFMNLIFLLKNKTKTFFSHSYTSQEDTVHCQLHSRVSRRANICSIMHRFTCAEFHNFVQKLIFRIQVHIFCVRK